MHGILLLWLALQVAPPDAAQHLRAGVEADKSRQLDTAIAEFQKAGALDPKLTAAFVDLGEVYIEKRDYPAAIAPLKRALALDPNLAPAHQLLGYALLAQGYVAEAIPHLQKAHEEQALGIALVQAGRFAEAVPILEKALEKNPNDPDLLYYFGRACGLLSKQAFDSLEDRFPDSARAHQMMAENYTALRDVPNAEREYRQALQARPDTPEVNLELGLLYAQAQQWDKAEESFRAQVESQPGSAEAAYRLGDALLQEGKIREARTELESSNKLKLDMPETLFDLGKAAALDDDAAQAEKYFVQVIALEKTSQLAAKAHFELAGLYRKQGRAADAGKEMQEFQKLQDAAGAAPAP
ncbi:MAG: tetratricopeptide repeat protein [Candidatus Acidiferrales bacterium]